MNKVEPDALDIAYRKASAADAGSLSAAARKAILAQARIAAHRRTPAANDSRYVWSAVAGVAVLGIAVVLWRQMDHTLPGNAQVVVAVAEQEAVTPTAPTATAPPAASQAITPPVVSAERDAVRAETTDSVAVITQSAPAEFAEAAAPPAATPEARDAQSRLEEVQVTGARAAQADRAALSAPTRESEALGLLREHFPAVLESPDRQTVWLVRNAQAQVVASGVLSAAQTLAEVANQLTTQGTAVSGWRTQTVTNARGQPILVALATQEP